MEREERTATNRGAVSAARLSIRVQDDGLCAWAEVKPGEPMDREGLELAIQEAGIVSGVDSLLCFHLANHLGEPDFAWADIPIATGCVGTDGEDGSFSLEFSALKQIGQVRADGSVDFKERFKIYSASLGDVLARYTPATKSDPGETVRGDAVEMMDGEDAKLGTGTGTKFNAQENTIVATSEGMISYIEDQSLSVLQLFIHSGDVDYESGNLRIEGSVAISGELRPEFEVQASGDVFVQGGGAGGTIRAAGNVAIAGAVSSSSGSTVRADGSVTCHRAANVEIVAGTTVLIEDHAVDTRIFGKDVRIDTGRGKLIGGVVHASNSIRVATAGNPSGTQTSMHVASLALQRRDQQEPGDSAATDSPDQRDPGWVELELRETAEIVVTGAVYPGVVVHFADQRHDVIDYAEDVIFRWDSDLKRIVMSSRAQQAAEPASEPAPEPAPEPAS